MRSAAQIVSYEIPAALAVLCPVLLSGSLSTQGIIRAQGGWPWQWFAFHDPFLFAAFLVYFIASLAEGNRTPFDIPEAESELVAGYNTEYSGFRFLAFLFAEWANLWIMGALAATAFLGGWQIPGVAADVQRGSFWLNVLGLCVFIAKVSALVFVIIQLRWTLPRLRVDQMMNVCWKYLVPISFVCLLGAAGWMIAGRAVPLLDTLTSPLMSLFGAALVASVFVRARYNRRNAGEPAYWKQLT
jgi:NADH-quinone oxidoreductase subunit H